MNPRTTWRWLLLVAALSALVFVHHRYFPKTESGPARILPKLNPAAVTTVQILVGQAEIRAARTNTTAWFLTQPLSYPAQATSIEILLRKLAGLRPMTSIEAGELKNRPTADEEFGFAKPEASILLEQGTEKTRLLVGARTGPGDQLYLQVVGVDAVYIVDTDLLKLIPKNANDWRDTTLLNFKDLVFDRLAVTNGGKVFELQRDPGNELWRVVRPFPARADTARIEQGLDKLQTLRAVQFVADLPKPDLENLGLQPAELELALGQGTNTIALLQFGKTNDAGQVYARVFGQNTIVTVASDLVAPWRAPVNDFRDSHLLVLTRPADLIEVRGVENFSVERQTNDNWQVLPQNFPADASLVKQLLIGLSALPIELKQAMVTESGLADYGLASPVLQYILQAKPESAAGASNSILAQLQFGSQKANRVCVRRTDETSVYAISTNDFSRLPSAGWQFRERRLWNFNQEDIAGATIRKDGKACQVIRKERYKWSLAPGSQGIIKNEIGLEETVRGLATAAAAAWVARGETNRARFGLRDGSLQVTIEFKTGEKAIVEFGAEAPSSCEYAAVTYDGLPWILEFPWPLFRDILATLPIP